ncbi:O-succinylbenzoate synthase [Flaviflexus salsibiostraticola]|uniref:o-succinylbenzoate synthase n=1 Tax=Flaviflexus salsibiostraticola TaxID=1282737 RepID=A0A3S8Z9E6_9ACTO|nr:o-succinylbenzoate synthase [Flaviflexus salsibiostraticola]AZN29956.1 O-succinylbenzoate synthase [Flaviflexus salsibiostraticola]
MRAASLPLPWRVYRTRLTTRFRGLDHRDGVLIQGPAGWAEVSPFWDYDIPESAPWLAAALEAAYLGYPTPVRSAVPVNVTVPATSPDRAREIIARRGGCETAKVKVAEKGQTLDDDLDRIAAVRESFGGRIRVDANAGWDVDTAIRAIPLLDKAARGLEYVEQPVASVEDLATVRAAVNVPIAADESIRRAEDPYRVAEQDAADLIICKVQPLGGVRACLRLAADIGLPVVVSSALESSVGIAAGVALAASLPTLDHACGLATVQLFDRDVASESLVPTDGSLPVRRVEPDTVPPGDAELEERWAERLSAMWDHLAATRDIGELTGGVL